MKDNPAKVDPKPITTYRVAARLLELESDIHNILNRVSNISVHLSGDDSNEPSKVAPACNAFDGSIGWLYNAVNDNANLVMRIKELLAILECITMEGSDDGQKERSV